MTTTSFGPFSRRMLLGTAIGGAGLLATGCSVFGEDEGTGGGEGAEGSSITIAIDSTIDTLDPHYVGASQYILPAGLMEGLLLQDETGTDVIPALAESWDVSEDQLTYTFHMRDGVTWSNGDPLTSADALWSFERLLTPTGASSGGTLGSTSYQPSMRIRGASDFQAGIIDSWEEVGITAPDDSTVEIELESPNPDFLVNMTHFSMTVLHQASVEADAQGWQQPENWVGNGPYLLTAWDPTALIEMEKNPEYWDAENVDIQHISYQLGGDLPTRVLAFQNNDLDILEIEGESLVGAPALEEVLTRVDGAGLQYLQSMWGGHPAIQDQRVRRAVSMAIDREALTAANPGSSPAGSLIPSSVPGWSEELSVAHDVDGARALLEEAGMLENPPGLRLLAGYEVPMLEIMREGLMDALGMDVIIDIVEAGVYVDNRWKPYESTSHMSYYFGSFGSISTMPTWTVNLFGPNHVRQFTLPYEAWQEVQALQADDSLTGPELSASLDEILSTQSSTEAQEYATMVDEAMSILDDGERNQAFLDAALVREQIASTIPLASTAQMWVTSDRISGLNGRAAPEGYYFKDLTVSE